MLAKVLDGRLAIRRGDLNATFEGAFRVALVCTQPRCHQAQSIDVAPPTAPRTDSQ
jgi:hypothetical protein